LISFSSRMDHIVCFLRKNVLHKKNTQIVYTHRLPAHFNAEIIRRGYGYQFDLKKVENTEDLTPFNGSTVFISEDRFLDINLTSTIDFFMTLHPQLGSVILVNGNQNDSYISEIQHVRRRETIAMTPANCHSALNLFIDESFDIPEKSDVETNKKQVVETVNEITNTISKVLVASSGLSMQYAIMMGLIHDALDQYKGKAIKFIVPPNCYGGTNDQARRVAAG